MLKLTQILTMRTCRNIICLLLLVCFPLSAQNTYFSTWYSADSNHLPQNSVKSIVADKYGFIWLSTESGIVRYDGKNFKLYNAENLPSMHYERMFLFGGNIDKDSIFIRDDYDQAYLIHQRTVKAINKPLPNRDLYPKQVKLTYMEVMHAYHVTISNEFFKVQGRDKHFVIGNDSIREYSKNQSVTKFIYKYPIGSQFFAIENNLYRLIKGKGYELIKPDKTVTGTFGFIPNGNHKIYTNSTARQAFLFDDGHLYYLTGKNGKIVPQLIFENHDPKINIQSLYYDTVNDILYLGSANKGLLVVKRQKFKTMSSPYKHSMGTDGVYYALVPFNNGLLASTGDLFENDRHSKKIFTDENSDKYALATDANGDIWTKAHEKLYRFKKNNNFTGWDVWDLKKRISTLIKGADGKIWFVAGVPKHGGTLYYCDPAQPGAGPVAFLNLNFETISLNSKNPGIMYIGSGAGLYKIDLNSKKTEKIKGFDDAYIREVYIKSDNEIWVASYNKGLYLYQNGKVTSFPADRNKYLLTSHCLVEDRNGFFWITTNRGIFQVKVQDLKDYATGKRDAIYYHHYDKTAGFLNNEFNGGCQPCGVYLNNKTIYFPSMDGIVYFKPEDIKPRIPKSDIYIDEIEIDGKNTIMADTLKISRNFGRIKIPVSSPFSGNAYNQNFEYKLEGPVTQGWFALLDNNITFSTLPPGNYKVTVRKLTGFGGQTLYKTVSFTIVPAFWQKTWFIVVLLLVVAAAVYYIVKLRIRYIRYKNILLEKKIVEQTSQLRNTVSTLRKTQEDLSHQVDNHKKLIKIITHDIKSPLRFMAITGRYLYNKFDGRETELKDDILAIHSSSTQLYEFVDNFLEYTKETDKRDWEPYRLYELVHEKTELFKNIAASKKITLINGISRDVEATVNRHLLSIILHNLTDNAVKYIYGATIVFTAGFKDNVLWIEVKDTGPGMPDDKVQYYLNLFNNKRVKEDKPGMGLPMIIELIHIMDGSLDIKAAEGKGTTITVYFTAGQ